MDINPAKDKNSDTDPEKDKNSDIDPEKDKNSDIDPEEDESSDIDPEEDESSDIDPEEDESSDIDPEEDESSDIDPEEDESSDIDPEADSWEKVVQNFREAVSYKSCHECFCCRKIFFTTTTTPKTLSKELFISKGASERQLRQIFDDDEKNTGPICQTCYPSVSQLRDPASALIKLFNIQHYTTLVLEYHNLL